MTATVLMLIWDFDTGIGQINATYPYNFRQEPILRELKNVEFILRVAAERDIRMTFACVGIAAETGPYPYHVPDLIRRIFAEGHEVASHSWKHEWFPFLEAEQIRRSLLRSKKILEECIGVPGRVSGFVPPFNRPMSWYRRLALSLGDRAWGPWYPGADIGKMIKFLRESGYRWARFSYKTLFDRFKNTINKSSLKMNNFERIDGLTIIPHHYCGFDHGAISLLEYAIQNNKDIVISGHPGALSWKGPEHIDLFNEFIDIVTKLRDSKKIRILTVNEQTSL